MHGNLLPTGDQSPNGPFILCVAENADDSKLDYRELVQGLVSSNKPIRMHRNPAYMGIPPNFDWTVQKRIEKNRATLYQHCEEALPFLIEGCTDARFSMVSQWSEDPDYYVWSVGRVCSEIISRHVEVFRDEMHFSLLRWHKYKFVPIPRALSEKEGKEIREWRGKYKGKSLRELQLAGFDWAIEKRKQELTVMSVIPFL